MKINERGGWMPVEITVEFVQQLMAQIRSLTDQNIQMENQVESLTATVAELNQTIKELRKQLNKNLDRRKRGFLLCKRIFMNQYQSH